MNSFQKPIAGNIRRTLLVVFMSGVVLLLTAGLSVAQEQRPEVVDPFAGMHASLARAANDALGEAGNSWRGSLHERLDSPLRTEPWSFETTSAPGVETQDRAGTNPSRSFRRIEALTPWLAPLLRAEGVPEALTGVVLVESGGQTDALSAKGARGLWQIMPQTAERYGLRIGRSEDQRLDPILSTRAAARYLRDLHLRFGNWQLALAAYNAGERTVEQAIRRAGRADFEALTARRLLPQETRAYVPAVLRAARLLRPRDPLETNREVGGAEAKTVVFAHTDLGAEAGAPEAAKSSGEARR